MTLSPSRRAWSVLLALLVALQPAILVGCNSASPDKRILQYLNQQGFGKRYVGNAEEENYVTIGDRISFADTYNPELRGTQQVEVDGTIQLPEVGAVPVAGLTRTELESYLTQRLAPYYLQTDVKIIIANASGRFFYVLGQVNREGPIPFGGDITVFEALLLAGPKEHQANISRIRVIRADPVDPLIIPVDMRDMVADGDSTSNIQLRENDIVYVPPTFLQQTADFIAGLLTPFLSVFNTVINVLLRLDNNNQGRRRRNNNNVF